MDFKKIIVVDDNPDITATIKYGLENNDSSYKVIPAESGKKCLEYLKQNSIPDLILLDIMMPEMSGLQTFDAIKANSSWKNIPIIFFSGITDETVKEDMLFLSDDFIEKPIDISSLKKKIDKILNK